VQLNSEHGKYVANGKLIYGVKAKGRTDHCLLRTWLPTTVMGFVESRQAHTINLVVVRFSHTWEAFRVKQLVQQLLQGFAARLDKVLVVQPYHIEAVSMSSVRLSSMNFFSRQQWLNQTLKRKAHWSIISESLVLYSKFLTEINGFFIIKSFM